MPIRKLSLMVSRYLARELNQPANQPIIDYGLQVIFGALFKGSIIVLISYLLGILTPTIAVASAAAALRIVSGGPHCTSYERCLITSLGVFLPLGYLGQLTQHISFSFQLALWSSVFAILLLIVVAWAPGEHPERPLTEKKKKFSKYLSFLLLTTLWSWAMIELLWFNGNALLMSILFGLVWQGFSITPLGYLLMNTLDQWLKNITPKEVTS